MRKCYTCRSSASSSGVNSTLFFTFLCAEAWLATWCAFCKVDDDGCDEEWRADFFLAEDMVVVVVIVMMVVELDDNVIRLVHEQGGFIMSTINRLYQNSIVT
jgi:hypothetical protein